MNAFVQKTTAFGIAALVTLTLFSSANASPVSANQLKAQQATTATQKITITAKRMTAEEKLQFDLANAA